MKILVITQGRKTENYTSVSNCLSSAFKQLNIDHKVFDLSVYLNRYLFYVIRKTPLLFSMLLKKINDELLEYICNNHYDQVFVIKGSYLLPETIAELTATNKIRVSCFNPDDPFNHAITGVFSNIRKSIKYYHHYFIWNRKLIEKIKEEGVRNVHYLPFAVDLSLVYPVKSPYIQEVSLICAVDEERQLYVDKICSNLQDGAKFDFTIYGNGWHPNALITVKKPVVGLNLLETIASSKVNLNILRLQNKGSINMRTFETPAAAGFSLHEYSEEAMEFFEADKEMVFFNSADELVEKSEFYLKNESARLKIAAGGYKRVIGSGYTYKHRVQEIVEKISE